MLSNLKETAINYGSSYSNWLQLMSSFSGKYYEVAISGEDAFKKLEELNKNYIPNKLVAGSVGESKIPLMEGRFNPGETFIYVCVEGACKLPESKMSKAINQMKIEF